MRLLAVEDDPIILELTTAMIQRLGGRVWQARDGIEALELFQTKVGETLAFFDGERKEDLQGMLGDAKIRRDQLPPPPGEES